MRNARETSEDGESYLFAHRNRRVFPSSTLETATQVSKGLDDRIVVCRDDNTIRTQTEGTLQSVDEASKKRLKEGRSCLKNYTAPQTKRRRVHGCKYSNEHEEINYCNASQNYRDEWRRKGSFGRAVIRGCRPMGEGGDVGGGKKKGNLRSPRDLCRQTGRYR